jgi:glutamyl/glutaminyl-tRNA synthetase
VIVRKDTPTSYHHAVVVDDALKGVTQLTRGRDLSAANRLHRLLQLHLGLSEPVYHHHMLIVGPTAVNSRRVRGSVAKKSQNQGTVPGWRPQTLPDAIVFCNFMRHRKGEFSLLINFFSA